MPGASLPLISEDSDPTRAKLIAAAGEVFAEVGFHAATVREICQRAGANVAAVNYHFRDKLGLYTEVLRESIAANQAQAMHEAVSRGKTPEESLRIMISGMLGRMFSEDRPAWTFRIMAHEMAQPTPALNQVVAEVMRPRYDQLRVILSQILRLPADHATTRLYAHSVVGQVAHYVHSRPVIGILWPDLNLSNAQDREMVANHIVNFTLHDLRAAKQSTKRKEKSK